jgi:hypothetical protein
MPFKLNHDRRHHIPRQQHKVTNWPAYEVGLRDPLHHGARRITMLVTASLPRRSDC